MSRVTVAKFCSYFCVILCECSYILEKNCICINYQDAKGGCFYQVCFSGSLWVLKSVALCCNLTFFAFV